MESLALILEIQASSILLCSPAVGYFTRAARRDSVVSAGSPAGVLIVLDRSHELFVPDGVHGRVVNERPERVLAPVAFGSLLYELAPIGAESAPVTLPTITAKRGASLAFRAPYGGRFWHRASPGEPPFATPGDVLEPGRTFGLVEVMKTFTHLAYAASGELPVRARLVRFVARDGAEIREGDALVEVEAT